MNERLFYPRPRIPQLKVVRNDEGQAEQYFIRTQKLTEGIRAWNEDKGGSR
jgi:hypothetical protein